MQDICTVAYHTCVQSIVTIVAQLTSSYNTYFKSSCYMASPLYNMSLSKLYASLRVVAVACTAV